MCTCGHCSICIGSENSSSIARGVFYTGSKSEYSKKSLEEVVDILDNLFQQNVQNVEIEGVISPLKLFVAQTLSENKKLKERVDELERTVNSLSQNLM